MDRRVPPVVRPPADLRRRIARRGIVVLLALCAGFAVWLVALSGLAQERAQVGLERRFRSELRSGLAPVNQPIDLGAPVARLRIPEIGLDEVVVEGSEARQLTSGPGHLRTSALPGQPGTAVVLGRRTAHGGPFGRLPSLRRGDPILVRTGQGDATYRVTGQERLAADDASAFVGDGDSLVLVTAAPPLTASERLVVRAELDGEPFAGGLRDGRGPVAGVELGLEGDGSAATGILVWSEVLALVAVGGVLLRRRWGRWPAWAVVVAPGAAALWGLYESLALLLPAAF